MKDSIVLLPTYNEKENIAKIIEAIFSLPKTFDILVIDDSSPDGTADIVRTIQEKYSDRLFLEERTGKLGLGTAYIHGFKWTFDKPYGYIFEIDADFSHNPADLVRLYKACHIDGADLAVGSRYTTGGKIENWPLGRIIMSYGASLYVKFITWMPVSDTTAGFVCYRKKVLQAINLDNIKCIGYAFQIEMKYAAWKLGFKLKEVPITFIDRVEGVSKMSSGIFKEAFFGVLKMQFRYLIGRAKKFYQGK